RRPQTLRKANRLSGQGDVNTTVSPTPRPASAYRILRRSAVRNAGIIVVLSSILPPGMGQNFRGVLSGRPEPNQRTAARSLALLAHPRPDVRRAMQQLDAFCFAGDEKTHDGAINERHLTQVEREP